MENIEYKKPILSIKAGHVNYQNIDEKKYRNYRKKASSH